MRSLPYELILLVQTVHMVWDDHEIDWEFCNKAQGLREVGKLFGNG